MAEKHEIAEFYREEAERYDETRLNNRPGQLKHERQTESLLECLAQGNVQKSDPVLEVGCGTGRFLNFLDSEGFTNLHGLDQSRGMIERTVEKCDPTGVTGDGYRLPFADDSFEAVYSVHVLMHLPNKQGFIDELQRVSRNLVVFELNNRHSLTGLAPLYRRLRNRGSDPKVNQSTTVSTLEEYTEYLDPWDISFVPTYQLPLSGPMGSIYYDNYETMERIYDQIVPDRFSSQLFLIASRPHES